MSHRKTLEELRREKEALRGPPLSARSLQSLRNLKSSLPAPRPRTQEPLVGGLERTPQPTVKLGTARGVPRNRPDETQEQFAERLRRGGRTEGAAGTLAARRFEINTRQTQTHADLQQRSDARDARRRASGLPTPDERSREAQRRIALRRGGQSLLSEINRRRVAQGRKPFGSVVRDEPIQIQSLDEVDPSVHGSGQVLQTPDGEFFRFNNINGVQSFTPQRIEPNTGQLVTDTSQIEVDEFKESLTNTEREVRRGLITDSGTLFARDLRAIQNNIAAIERAKSSGTTAPQTAQEQIEKLREDEAELMFEFDKTIGFGKAFLADTAEDIARQEAQEKARVEEQKQRVARFKEEQTINSALLKDAIKFLQDQAKIVAAASQEVGTQPKPVTEDQIQAEFQRRKRLLQSTTPREIIDTTATSEFQTSAGLFEQTMASLGATPEEIAQRDVGRGAMPQETLPNGEAGFYSPVRSEVVSAKDIQFTAEDEGISVEQVMKVLGIIP